MLIYDELCDTCIWYEIVCLKYRQIIEYELLTYCL